MIKSKHFLLAFAAAGLATAAGAQTLPAPVAAPAAPAAPAVPALAAAPAAPVVAAAAPAGAYKTEIVCKSELETGSLVKKHKTCLTRKQWVYVNNEHETAARKMVDDNMGRPSGN